MNTVHVVLSAREIDGVSTLTPECVFSTADKAYEWISLCDPAPDRSFVVEDFVVDERDEPWDVSVP